MMNKKEIIEKIMKEYSQYGLSRIEVEISYVMAILWRVPKESIYPGMKMIYNKVYGIEDETPEIEAGKALFESTLREVREENPDVSDSDIANGVEYIGIDTMEESLNDLDFLLLSKVKESMLQSTREFVNKNV